MKPVLALVAVSLLAGIAVWVASNQATPQLPAPSGSTVTRQTWRESLHEQFPDLDRQLDLTPEATSQFLDLLARQQADLWKDAVDIVIGAAEDTAIRLEWQGKLVQQLRANHAELMAALGARHTAWLQYQAGLAIRQQVERLQARLEQGDNPLPPERVGLLSAALVAEQSRLDEELRQWNMSAAAAESPDLLDEHLRRRAADRQRLLSVASAWLSAAQQEQYRQVLEHVATREAALKRVVGLLATAPVQPRPALPSTID